MDTFKTWSFLFRRFGTTLHGKKSYAQLPGSHRSWSSLLQEKCVPYICAEGMENHFRLIFFPLLIISYRLYITPTNILFDLKNWSSVSIFTFKITRMIDAHCYHPRGSPVVYSLLPQINQRLRSPIPWPTVNLFIEHFYILCDIRCQSRFQQRQSISCIFWNQLRNHGYWLKL